MKREGRTCCPYDDVTSQNFAPQPERVEKHRPAGGLVDEPSLIANIIDLHDSLSIRVPGRPRAWLCCFGRGRQIDCTCLLPITAH